MKRIGSFTVIFIIVTLTMWPMTLSAQVQQYGWGEDTRLTFTENTSAGPAIAAWEDNIHVVWIEPGVIWTGDSWVNYRQLWYRNSTDGGDTWNNPICLSNSYHTMVALQKIAVNGSNIHVVWVEGLDLRVHYIRSIDNGNSWSSDVVLTPRVYHLTDTLDIAVYEDSVHVVYMDYDSLFSYINSYDNGMSWNPPQVLSATTSPSTYTDIDIDQRTVHVVWQDSVFTPSGRPVTEIFYIKSMDNGITWVNIINITRTPLIENHYVDMDIFDERIYVVYGHKDGVRQAYLSYSEDNGVSWIRNTRLTDSDSRILYPAIAANEDWIFVLWGSWGRVYYKYSRDRGSTWCNDTAFTNENQTSIKNWPRIVAGKNVFHIVWVDRRDGNYEIYYTRYVLPSMPVSATIDIDPDTLNLKSKGRWITAYIELPEGYDVSDIDISTIMLEDTIPAEDHPSEVGDHDGDGIPDLMVKFDRSDVEDILTPSDSITLTLNGYFLNGGSFKGNDSIRVIQSP